MGDVHEQYELPKANISRLIKQSLPEGVTVQKEAKQAITKAAKIWILYATACSNDYCMNCNRTTISANDVLSAMDELEYNHFVEPLKETMEQYKKEQANKATKKGSSKK